MAGRMFLVLRLVVRDLLRHRTETALLLIAITAATGTLTLGLALNGIATRPFAQTRDATAGPDVVVKPRYPGPDTLAALTPLATRPGVTASSGPFPLAFLMVTARGKTVHTVVEGRDAAPASVDRPAVTDGGWVRPGGVVVERGFADALGVHPGDTVSVGGRALRVLGTAVTAAWAAYPYVGWHQPGDVLTDHGGLVWVDRGDIAGIAGDQQLSYTLNLKLADPAAGPAFLERGEVDLPTNVTTWQEIAGEDDRLVKPAQEAVLTGSWLLTLLALAGVVGTVAGRVIGQRRRVGLLKAVGAGPAMVAALYLAEYLVVGLAGAGCGLVAGWLSAPALTRPGAGLIGSVGTPPPALHTVVAATTLAVGIALAATLAPVVRAATTSTIHALADAATPPRRRRWRIWLSRRLPTALLIGVRINARRPRRARLLMMNTLITTTGLVAVLFAEVQNHQLTSLGDSTLPDPRGVRLDQALLVVTVALCVLALINTVVNTWTAVLDARQPLAVARTLGATPGQAGVGLATAQLLPAVPGVAAGVLAGTVLIGILGTDNRHPPYSGLFAMALGVLFAVAALTAIPAMADARRPVADTLRSAPT